ncbi:MAG TPA: hypothetical protein VFV52_18040 [Bacilli bacterium]|nr:hypothetical protein [Bacilli bacterium]
MTWLDELKDKLATQDTLQLSIDGQIWTIERHQGGYTCSNGLGRVETFSSIDQVETALQSWFENPAITFVG